MVDKNPETWASLPPPMLPPTPIGLTANERAAQRRFIRRMGTWAKIASSFVAIFAIALFFGWLIR